NCFRLVDVFLMIGGILCTTKTKSHKILWISYRVYTYLIYTIQIIHAVEKSLSENSVVATSWCVMAVLMVLIAFLNENIIQKSAPMIDSVRQFICRRSDTSSDYRYDLAARKNFVRTSQIVSLGVLLLIIMDEMFIPLILIFHEERIFGIPHLLSFSNLMIRETVHLSYLIMVLPIWLSKMFIPIVLSTLLITGIRSELEIFTKEFEEFCTSARKHAHNHRENIFWSELTAEVNIRLAKHASYLEIQHQLGSLLSKLFLVTYYGDVISIGTMIFALLKEGFSPSSPVLLLSIVSFLTQCYWWCTLAEYFQDNNDAVQQHLTDLMIAIPYREQQKSYYRQLRTSLMILKTCTTGSTSMKMAGEQIINMQIVSRLLNISYSAVTFLIDMDD
ncbi:AAEL017149-PA, partial [Aedes aegypti]